METLVRDVLAAWREAERRENGAVAGSLEGDAAHEAVRRLTLLYRAVVGAEASPANVKLYRASLAAAQRQLGPEPEPAS